MWPVQPLGSMCVRIVSMDELTPDGKPCHAQAQERGQMPVGQLTGHTGQDRWHTGVRDTIPLNTAPHNAARSTGELAWPSG